MQTDFTRDIFNKDPYSFTYTLPGDEANIATNYGYAHVTTRAIEILGVVVRYTAVAEAGSFLDVLAVPDGMAISAGTTILDSPFPLSSPANVTQSKTGKQLTLVNSRTLKPNEALGLLPSGTLSGFRNLTLTVFYKYSHQGSYRTPI